MRGETLLIILLLVGMNYFVMDQTEVDGMEERINVEENKLSDYQFSGHGDVIPNMGQIQDRSVLFSTQNTYFTENGVFFREFTGTQQDPFGSYSVYSMELDGCNDVIPYGIDRTGTIYNYFLGTEENWASGVPGYSGIIYRDIYDGIDLIYRVKENGLKYDLIVHPGGDPDDIEMEYQGCSLTTNGKDLFIDLDDRTVVDGDLYVYQNTQYGDQQVDARIVVQGQSVGFNVEYDPEYDLVIDPMIYSTLIGGSMFDDPSSLVEDESGNIYIYGMTDSSAFPTTTGSYQPSYGGFHDNFISKFNSDGSRLLVSTFLGGSEVEYSSRIFIDPDGNFVVTGSTDSDDFPTTTTFNNAYFDGSNTPFYCKFDPSLSNLMISAFIFSNDVGWIYDTEMDGSGDVWFTGTSSSDTLPVTSDAYQQNRSGERDAFLIEIGKDLSSLKYCSYFGGTGNESGSTIRMVGNDEICIGGNTGSSDLPTAGNAFSTGNSGDMDMFISVLSPSTGVLRYSTYFGGSDFDSVIDVFVIDGNDLVIYGTSGSFDLPVTQNAYDTTKPGSLDPFILRLDLTTNCPDFSSYLGSSENDFPACIYVNDHGIHVVGRAVSSSYPTTDGAYDTQISGNDDMYYSLLSNDGSALLYSTFIGGNSYEFAVDMFIDDEGRLLLTGDTRSTNFPVTSNAYQRTQNGGTDGFLLKFDLREPPATPIDVNVQKGDMFINISWRAGNDVDVDEYRIYRGSDIPDISLHDSSGENTFYNDTDVKNGVVMVYQISAYNEAGESSPTNVLTAAPGGPPSEPYGLTSRSLKNRVLLEWSAPNTTRGYDLSGYNILRSISDGPLERYRSIENETEFEDTYIENGIQYRYAIQAENLWGKGPLSNVVTALPGGVPGPITNIGITEQDSSLFIKWKVPDDNGFLISEYIIFRGTSEEDLLQIYRSTENFYTDMDLVNGIEYFYTVTAVNIKGESEGNVIVSGSPSSIPGYPVVECLPGDGFVMVNWYPPEDDGGRGIIKYRVFKGSDPNSLILEETLSDLELNITDLINGSPVYIAVSASNENGYGPLSDPIECIPSTTPSSVGSVYAEQDSDVIRILWSAPIDTGGLDILEYIVFKGTDPSDLQEITRVNSTEITDNDFQWGIEYFYAVSAVNSLGQGELSQIISGIPMTLPGVPGEGTVETGLDHVMFTWQIPQFDGGSEIRKYRIYRGPSEDEMIQIGETTDLEFNDTSLEQNTTYTYRITAVNKMGEGLDHLLIEARTDKEIEDEKDDPDGDIDDTGNTQEENGISIVFVISIIGFLFALLIIGTAVLIIIVRRMKTARPPMDPGQMLQTHPGGDPSFQHGSVSQESEGSINHNNNGIN